MTPAAALRPTGSSVTQRLPQVAAQTARTAEAAVREDAGGGGVPP